jgi:hypothetical protein
MEDNAITTRLRELWKEKNWKDFHRVYALGKWMMPKEDQIKIDTALRAKGWLKEQQNTSGQQLSMKDLLKAFPGSKIIE